MERLFKPFRKKFIEAAEDSCEGHIDWASDNAEDLCKSEIEKIFFTAWVSYLEWKKLFHYYDTSIRYNSPGETFDFDEWIKQFDWFQSHLDLICCQFPIGKYSGDFAIQRAVTPYEGGIIKTPIVIVECDGHDFHERTKEQAEHDKSRDRYIQSVGYPVLRFTGSAIWNRAWECVEEVDKFLNENIKRQRHSNRKSSSLEQFADPFVNINEEVGVSRG